jgi:cell division protein DivIC
MAAIAFVALVLLVSLIGQSRTLSQRLAVYDARAAVLKQSIEEETERTQEIQELKEYMQTDAYVEEIAREKLGLVKDNEIVFIEEN